MVEHEKLHCLEHSGVCERLVNVESDTREIRGKIDKFFWFLFVTLVASLGSLGGMFLNLYTSKQIATAAQALTKGTP